MDIILYRNISPPNQVRKRNEKNAVIRTKDQGTLVSNVRFIEDGALDILNPSLLLQLTDDIENVVKFNYVKIPKYERFYYIDKITTEGGLIRMDCRCDVLMSHSADILASRQYILRQETKYKNPYLFDNLLPITSDHNYYAEPFGNPVFKKDCGYVILATTGIGGDIIPRP